METNKLELEDENPEFFNIEEYTIKSSIKLRDFSYKLVMDTFVNTGLLSLAQTFKAETGCQYDSAFTRKLQELRRLITTDLDAAIHFLDALGMNSKNFPRLHFELEKLKFIELCDSKEVKSVLLFCKIFSKWDTWDEFRAECRTTFSRLLDIDRMTTSDTASLLREARIHDVTVYASGEMAHYYGRDDVDMDNQIVLAEDKKYYPTAKEIAKWVVKANLG